jgi:hypothetical protein
MLKQLALAAGAILLAAVCALGAVACARAAGLAADATTVHIPWGQWLAEAIGLAIPAAASWATWLATRLGVPWVQNILVNDAVQRAIGSGLATVQGAVANQTLDVAVADDVARAALAYLVDHEPMIVRWLGAAIGPRIVAEIGSMGLAPADGLASPKL